MRPVAIILILLFGFDSVCHGLATLPASRNITAKRGILAALQRTQVIVVGPHDEYASRLFDANNSECLLLSSGKYLIAESAARDDLRLLVLSRHEEIEAIMQVLLDEYKRGENTLYGGIRELILKHFPPVKDNLERYYPLQDYDSFSTDLYVNHVVAGALQWLTLINEEVVLKSDIPDEERPFVASMEEIVSRNKHNYFTAEFLDPSVRAEKIRSARNDGMVFYQVAAADSGHRKIGALNKVWRAIEFRTSDDIPYPGDYPSGSSLCYTGVIISPEGKVVAWGRGGFADKVIDKKGYERSRKGERVVSLNRGASLEDINDAQALAGKYVDSLREEADGLLQRVPLAHRRAFEEALALYEREVTYGSRTIKDLRSETSGRELFSLVENVYNAQLKKYDQPAYALILCGLIFNTELFGYEEEFFSYEHQVVPAITHIVESYGDDLSRIPERDLLYKEMRFSVSSETRMILDFALRLSRSQHDAPISRSLDAYTTWAWASAGSEVNAEAKLRQIALIHSCYLKNRHDPLDALELCARIFDGDSYKALRSSIRFIAERYKLRDASVSDKNRLPDLALQCRNDFDLDDEEARILSFAIDLGLGRYRFSGINYDRVRSKADWLSVIRQDGDSGFAEYISQQKACLSVDPIVGCSIDCAYCFRSEKDEKRPVRLKEDLEIVVELFNHPFFVPDRTPIGLQISKTDPLLPQVKASTFAVLEFLDGLGLQNQVFLVTKVPLKEEDVKRLAGLKHIRLSVGCTFSNMPRAVEPLSDPERTANTIALLKRFGIKAILFLRPLIIGQNDSDESLRTALSVAKESGVDAILVGGLRLSEKERSHMRKCGIVIPPYETADYKKYLPKALHEKLIRIYKDLGLKMPMVRRQSCARSILWGIPDFNAHWTEPRSNCWETCPLSQKTICAGKERPAEEEVESLLSRIERDGRAFTITDTAVVFDEALSVFEKSFLRNNLSFQVEDREESASAARGDAVSSAHNGQRPVFEKRYELENKFLGALRAEFTGRLSAIMRKYNMMKEPDGMRSSREITELYYEYVVRIFEYCRQAFKEEERYYIPVSLIALGGSFFRREMSPGSDIDFGLMFDDEAAKVLIPVFRKKFSALLEKFGVTKADAHLVSQIVKRMGQGTINNIDKTIAEETRFLGGDPAQVDEFSRKAVQYHDDLVSSRPLEMMESFTFDIVYQRMRWQNYENDRSDRFNIKKGRGGLRDITQVIWLARLLELRKGLMADSVEEISAMQILTPSEKKTIIEGLNFLLAVRNTMHSLSAEHTDDQLDPASAEEVAKAVRWAGSGMDITKIRGGYSDKINKITERLTNIYIEKVGAYKGRAWLASFTRLLSETLPGDELAKLYDTAGKETEIAMLVAYRSEDPELLRKIYNDHADSWPVYVIVAANSATPDDILLRLGSMDGYMNRDIRVWVARNKSPPIEILMKLSRDNAIHVRSAAKAGILRLEPLFSKLVDICGDFNTAVDLMMARMDARGSFTDSIFREELQNEIETANILYGFVERMGFELYNGEGYEGAKRKVIARLYSRPDRGLEDLSTSEYIPGGFTLGTFIDEKGFVAEDYNAVMSNILRVAEHSCADRLAVGDEETKRDFLRSFKLLLETCFASEGRYVNRKTQEECVLMLYNFARLYFGLALTDMSIDPMRGYKKKAMDGCARLLEDRQGAFSASPVEERIRALLKLKISANRIDVVSKDLIGRSVDDLMELVMADERHPLAIDDRDEFMEEVVGRKRLIAWDLDNAAEAPMTLYLIQEILSHWQTLPGDDDYKITIIPKAMPIVDDTTYDDLTGLLKSSLFARLRKYIDDGRCEILKRGPCGPGTNFRELSIEQAQAYREIAERDGVVIKDGLANLNTSAGKVMKTDTFYLFAAKGPWARKVVGRFESEGFSPDAGVAHFVPKELLASGMELFYGTYPSDEDERSNFSDYVAQQHSDFHDARQKYMKDIRPLFSGPEGAISIVRYWMRKGGGLTFAEAVRDLCEFRRMGIDIGKDSNCRLGKVDFHVHSAYSADGSISLEYLVKAASFLGLEAIAISDHATVDGIREAVRYGDRLSIAIVPAVELSAVSGGTKVHVLGYNIDWENDDFKKALEGIQGKWDMRLKKVLATIGEKTGHMISLDEVKADARSKYCDLDSIAATLVKRGLASSVTDATERYLSRGSPAGTNAYEALSDAYLIQVEDAVRLIKRFGGIPVVAHPAKGKELRELAETDSFIMESLIPAGIEGIEVFHPSHSEEARQHLMRLAEKNGMLVFGGSDYDGNPAKGIELGVGTATSPIDIPYSRYIRNILKVSMMSPMNSDEDIAGMSLEQKVAHIIRPGFEWLLPYGEDRRLFNAFGIPFGRLNERYLTGPEQVAEKVNELLATSGQPVLLNLNQEGGRLNFFNFGNTQMPGNMAIAATRSEKDAYQSAAVIAKEMRSMGVTWNIIPMCEAVKDGRNPSVGTRSFGEDIALVSAMTRATIQGSQDNGVACMAKLFPGSRLMTTDPHEDLDTVEIIEEDDLAPFKAAIEADVASVMVNHAVYSSIDPDNPATLSKKIMTGLLREKLGFKGLIITDTLTMGAIRKHYSIGDAAVKAIEAGADIAFIDPDLSRIKSDIKTEESSNDYGMKCKAEAYRAILQAVRDGRIAEKRIDESLRRILEVKRRYGIAEKVDPAAAVAACNSPQHKELERIISANSITLLRNRTGMLPLTLREREKILVVTAKPDKIARADSAYEVAFRLADYARKLHQNTENVIVSGPEDISSEKIASADVVIAVTYNAYFPNSQGRYAQKEMVDKLLASGKPVIVCAIGSPYDIMRFPDIDTYLASYNVRDASMQALADVLFGIEKPKGKLPVTIPGLFDFNAGETNFSVSPRATAADMDRAYVLILAGGGGTRLWPLSTQEKPKSFCSFFPDGKSMTRRTVERALAVVPKERILIGTPEHLYEAFRKELPEFSEENFIVEPMPKDTANAIGFAAVALSRMRKDATMLVLSGDQEVGETEKFVQSMKDAVRAAQSGPVLVPIGIKPTSPHTGYGYIETGEEVGIGKGVYRGVRFVEKPDVTSARKYLDAGNYYWNGGMFVWDVKTILSEFARLQPLMYEKYVKIRDAIGTQDEDQVKREMFEKLPRVSIDLAIMEQTDNTVVVGEFPWSDLGDWNFVAEFGKKDADGNVKLGSGRSAIDAGRRCIVFSLEGQDVTVEGLDDTTVVVTNSVVLVTRNASTQNIKGLQQDIADDPSLKVYIEKDRHLARKSPGDLRKAVDDNDNNMTGEAVVKNARNCELYSDTGLVAVMDVEDVSVIREGNNVRVRKAPAAQAPLFDEKANYSDRYDVRAASVLSFDLLYSQLHSDRIYEIKYDTAYLTRSQIDILEEYLKLLKLRSVDPDNIRVRPFSSANGSKESLIAVYCTGKSFKGEGHVDVSIPEGEIKDYLLRVTGMLNIALASANIPDNLLKEDVDKYRPLLSYINNQYKAILGEALAIPESPEDILKTVRRIVLGLPKAMRMNTDKIEEFNRLAKEALTAA